MDGGSESRLWTRIARFFHNKNNDTVEQAIIEASEEGELQKEEGSMLLSVLHLDDMQVQDIMTPRTDVVCAPISITVAEIVDLILSSGHSRIPIYRDNRDNIVGVIYAKDLLRHAIDPSQRDAPVTELLHPPFFVPETKNVLDLLHDFKSSKKHLAIILDEYGGTAGIITIEDVLEQIVGDIEDEHDAPRQEDILLLENGSATLSGRAYLEDIADQLGIVITSDEVDTIGGFLCHLAGRVPQAGENFVIAGTRFTVTEADAKQIKTIRAESVSGSDAAARRQNGATGLAATNQSASDL